MADPANKALWEALAPLGVYADQEVEVALRV
jgi:hypothetical protein